MRQKRDPQRHLLHLMARNKVARELEAISLVLDQNPGILDLVFRDLVKYQRTDTGRGGMTAEQVLRCAILKRYRELTYEELAFHLEDSMAFRSFARLGRGQYPCGSTLQDNIKAIAAETWEAMNLVLLEYAGRQKVEKGHTVRMDSTVVETHIHHPTDSTLLLDGIRAITRLLQAGKALNPAPWYPFADHRRAAKKRGLQILNARKDQVRLKAYRELLSLAGKVQGYARQAITELKGFVGADLEETSAAHKILDQLERAVSRLQRVLSQTERRVLRPMPPCSQICSAGKRRSMAACLPRRRRTAAWPPGIIWGRPKAGESRTSCSPSREAWGAWLWSEACGFTRSCATFGPALQPIFPG
jgi:transposase, IS5 family